MATLPLLIASVQSYQQRCGRYYLAISAILRARSSKRHVVRFGHETTCMDRQSFAHHGTLAKQAGLHATEHLPLEHLDAEPNDTARSHRRHLDRRVGDHPRSNSRLRSVSSSLACPYSSVGGSRGSASPWLRRSMRPGSRPALLAAIASTNWRRAGADAHSPTLLERLRGEVLHRAARSIGRFRRFARDSSHSPAHTGIGTASWGSSGLRDHRRRRPAPSPYRSPPARTLRPPRERQRNATANPDRNRPSSATSHSDLINAPSATPMAAAGHSSGIRNPNLVKSARCPHHTGCRRSGDRAPLVHS